MGWRNSRVRASAQGERERERKGREKRGKDRVL